MISTQAITAGANSRVITFNQLSASDGLGEWEFGVAGNAEYTIANFSAVRLGYTTRLRTDTAAGFTAVNDAQSATNDSTDFVFSTTGVTTSPNNRSVVIRGTTNTNGNQQLLGATVVKANMHWLRVRARSRSGTPTITIGDSSGGSQYVASVGLTTAWKNLTIALANPIYTAGNSNIWIGSNSTDVVEVEIIGELPL